VSQQADQSERTENLPGGEAEATHESPSGSIKKRFPWITCLVLLYTIYVHVSLELEENLETWETLSRWGFFPPNRIWDGNYWGLLLSSFIHFNGQHLGANLSGLLLLGPCLERTIGAVRWCLLFILSSFVTSSFELAFSETTGVGMSGVLFTFFGFMWFTREKYSSFMETITYTVKHTILAWLVICILLSIADVMSFGNAAHVSGLLLGCGLGKIIMTRWPRILLPSFGVSALISFSFLTLFWCPWSGGWISYKADQAYSRMNYQKALDLYQRSIRISGEEGVYELYQIASLYQELSQAGKARETVERLRKVNKEAAEEFEKAFPDLAN
jgi:rhomboid protease GluP